MFSVLRKLTKLLEIKYQIILINYNHFLFFSPIKLNSNYILSVLSMEKSVCKEKEIVPDKKKTLLALHFQTICFTIQSNFLPHTTKNRGLKLKCLQEPHFEKTGIAGRIFLICNKTSHFFPNLIHASREMPF